MAKSNRKQALGRGLSALLNDPDTPLKNATDQHADEVIGNIIDLQLDLINTNPFQPRKQFNEERLRELSQSISELGIVQPITVRRLEDGQFQLVSGARRFRASKLAGLESIPAYVRLANDQESLEMALVENIQRQDLDPIEIALSYQRLIDEIELTQDQLSNRVGKQRSTITNYLRLLKLDPIIQTGMRDGFLSMGHGRALINVDNTAVQLDIYQKILRKGLSVRATEALVREYKNPKSKPAAYQPVFVTQVAEELEQLFDTKVAATSNTLGKGSIKISFDSQKKLQAILNKIKGAS